MARHAYRLCQANTCGTPVGDGITYIMPYGLGYEVFAGAKDCSAYACFLSYGHRDSKACQGAAPCRPALQLLRYRGRSSAPLVPPLAAPPACDAASECGRRRAEGAVHLIHHHSAQVLADAQCLIYMPANKRVPGCIDCLTVQTSSACTLL